MSKLSKLWVKLRVRCDGVPRRPWSRYKVYDGETILSSVDRIPFLRQFIWHYDEFERVHGPRYDGIGVNAYMGEQALKVGGPVTIEVINKLLKTARERGDME